jgi:hypothetical protein
MRPCCGRSPRRATTRPKERSHAPLPRQLVQHRGRPGDGHRWRPHALPPGALALAVVLGPEPRGVDGPPVRGVQLSWLLPGPVERRRLQERQARPLPPEHQLGADRQRGGGLPVLLTPRALPEAEVARPRPRALRFRSSGVPRHRPPLRAKARYGPGFLSAFFLHVPIGINYLRAVGSERPWGGGSGPARRPTRSPSLRSGSARR